ncbi:BrnT family toxin [candidate division KSB1 bacterium]|nr:BrnT family toxin [candidate division KSB1 bacterium]
MDYEWDPDKAASNERKHGIKFVDAIGAIEDSWGLTAQEEYVDGELRFATIGLDFRFRIIVVVYTYRENNIRLITARPTTKNERRAYESKRI